MGRLSQAESRSLTRARLLDSAERVFAEKGFGAASLEEIAEAAGYSRGALYYNFADKDELFIALLERRLAADIDTVSGLITQSDDSLQLIGGLRERRGSDGRSMQEGRRRVQLSDEFRLYALRNESARKKLADHQRHLLAAYANGITAVLRRLGITLPAPAESLASLIMALDEGLVRQRCVDPTEVKAELFYELLGLLIRSAQALQETSESTGRGE